MNHEIHEIHEKEYLFIAGARPKFIKNRNYSGSAVHGSTVGRTSKSRMLKILRPGNCCESRRTHAAVRGFINYLKKNATPKVKSTAER
jgi:hypothetical protein